MNWSIDFAPFVPMPVLWVAFAVAALLIGLIFFRRTRGAAFRTAAVLTLLAALANPTIRQEDREELPNIAIAVVDESVSQQLAERPEQTRAIKEDLERRLERIPNLDVKWVTAKGETTGAARGTQIFSALNSALSTTPTDRVAGVVIISDGQIHDAPQRAEELGIKAPVHVLLTGKQGEFDRRIETLTAPRYGLVGETRVIEIAVREHGRANRRSDEKVILRIRREGQNDEIRAASVNERVSINMPFPHAGTNIVEVELEAADDELTQANNRVVVAAEGVRENLRVLLVSGEPHPGERTWRNLLKSDAAVDLVHFTILRPPEKQDGTPISQLSLIAFPTRELFSEKIKDFDLIIFDRYEHRGILQLIYYDNISRYVEGGGAVLVAAGDDFAGRRSLNRTPLAPALPAEPTGRVLTTPFKAQVTGDGFRHPVTRALPGANSEDNTKEPTWGRWFRQAEITQKRGRALMTGAGDNPLLVLDRRGEGRVALMSSDHAWLWARGFEGGGPHTDLLRRLSHWLMKEPDLEEERILASARGLTLTIERRTLEDSVEPVTISGPGGDEEEIELEKKEAGVWRANVEVELPGLYKVETEGPDGRLTGVTHAGVKDRLEMSEVVATEKKLDPILDSTGGGAFWTSTTGSARDAPRMPSITMMSGANVMAGSSWMGLLDREAYITRGVRLTPLFEGWAALLVLLGLMALAWWREGR